MISHDSSPKKLVTLMWIIHFFLFLYFLFLIYFLHCKVKKRFLLFFYSSSSSPAILTCSIKFLRHRIFGFVKNAIKNMYSSWKIAWLFFILSLLFVVVIIIILLVNWFLFVFIEWKIMWITYREKGWREINWYTQASVSLLFLFLRKF